MHNRLKCSESSSLIDYADEMDPVIDDLDGQKTDQAGKANTTKTKILAHVGKANTTKTGLSKPVNANAQEQIQGRWNIQASQCKWAGANTRHRRSNKDNGRHYI